MLLVRLWDCWATLGSFVHLGDSCSMVSYPCMSLELLEDRLGSAPMSCAAQCWGGRRVGGGAGTIMEGFYNTAVQ